MYNWIINMYASVAAKRKVNRYITGCSVVFGKKIERLNRQAGNVAGGRLRVFNSFQETVNQQPISGAQEIIDTYKFPIVGKVILQKGLMKELMEMKANPYTILTTRLFGVSCLHQGKIKYFAYNPKFMMMDLSYTVDEKVYNEIQEAAKYESALNDLMTKAQRNARLLALVAKRIDLTATQRQRVNEEISKHLYIINTANYSLPSNFKMDVKSLKADKIQGIGLPFLIPVIVWVVAIITTGVAVIGFKWANSFKAVKINQNTLDDRLKAIMSISNEVDRNIALTAAASTDNKNLTTATDAAAKDTTSTGMFGQIKQIAVVGLIALIAKEIFSRSSK